jgi:hypothetical protein
MAAISVAEDTLAVTLTLREKLAAARGDVSVPLAAGAASWSPAVPYRRCA